MDLRKPLAIACTLIILIQLIISKNKRRTFVLSVVSFFPFMDLLLTPATKGGFTVFDVVSFLAFIFVARELRFTTNRNLEYLLMFFTISFLLILGSFFSEFSSNSVLFLIQFFPVFIFGKALLDELSDDPGFTTTLIHTARIICLASVVFLFAQVVVGLKFSFYPSLNTNTFTSGSARYPSFFHDPQKYAQFLSMGSFLFLVRTNHPAETTQRRYFFFFLVIIAMFLTGARAAFSGLCIGLAIVFLIGESKYRTAGLVGALGGYVLILLFGQYFPLFNREESYTASYEFRNHIWQEAVQIFKDNPVLGIGIGNYQSYVTRYSTDQFWFLPDGDVMYFDHPESGYLKMLTEYGLLSFIVLCLFVIVPIFTAVRNYLSGYTDNRVFYFIGGISGWLISYITVYSLSDRRVLIMLAVHICLLIMSGKGKLEELNEGNKPTELATGS